MDSIIEMKVDLEMLKSAFGQSLKAGPVTHVDAEKGYRFSLGTDDDGGEFLSPWLPHPETAKSSVPLKKGDMIGVIAPSGDLQQGLIFRGGYSKDHASPNDNMDANVFDDAGVRVELKENLLIVTIGPCEIRMSDAGLRVAVGGVVWDLTSDGQAQTAGQVTHNEINIGDDHKHKDVIAGPDLTGPPVG